MVIGVIVYPAVWSGPRVREVCETSENYYIGKCRIEWAYILAILGMADIFVVAILALVLSRTQVGNFKIKGRSYQLQPQVLQNENASYSLSTNDFNRSIKH